MKLMFYARAICIVLIILGVGVPAEAEERPDLEDLEECSDERHGFTWLWFIFRRHISNARGAMAQMRMQLGNKEAAERGFEAASLIDPCNPWLHFNLATLRTKRGDYEGAEASYAAAVHLDPQDPLVALLYSKIRQQRAQADFWGQMVSILNDHPDIRITDEGSLDIPKASHSKVKLRFDRAGAVFEQWAPMRLVMNLDRISDAHLQQLLQTEATEFDKACDEAGRPAAKLPGALQAVRELENSTKFLIPWAMERLRHFHAQQTAMSVGAYGITWFAAWKTIFARPSVAALFRHYGRANVYIVGSALGYQCFYALALGASQCIGYEVLCKTMVSHARNIVSKNNLVGKIEYRCQDARNMKGLANASLVIINDETYTEDLRSAIFRKVAADLRPGALAVSFAPPGDPHMVFGLAREDAVRVEVSWSYVAPVFIYRKLAPGQAARPPPPPIPMPGSQRGRRKKGKLSSLLNFDL